MKFVQIVLATVLSFLWVGQAFANAPEERILIESTKSGNWQQFLTNLAKVEMGDVKGYDPETDTIYTAAVLVWVCQNQASAWQAACANKPERFTALKARNGWSDTMTGAELQAQGQGKGIFFPFATPVATPVTAVTYVAAVTPEQLVALEATFAKAQAALEMKAAENAQAIISVRQQLSAKETEIASLRDALEKAPTAEAMTALKVQIVAQNTARDALKKSVAEQIDATIIAAGIAATKAAEPAMNRATVAIKAAGTFEAKAKAVDGRVSTVEKYLLYVVGAIGIIALLVFWAYVELVKNRRQTRMVKDEFKELDEQVQNIQDEVDLNKASSTRRQVQFPDRFGMLCRALGLSDKEEPQTFVLQVEGVGKVSILVEHARLGYVYVTGVPGHDPKDEVRLQKTKASKRYNGVELLVFGAANRCAFDRQLTTLKVAA